MVGGCINSQEINPRICEVEGCFRIGQHMGSYYKTGERTGQPRRRKTCSKHHGINYGLNGWDYKKYRKTFCENIDGRLGFVCTTTIMDVEYQLEVDHIDENHKNSEPCNLQTLCACCHRIKTKYRRTNNEKALNLMLEFVEKSCR
jgi:5-methylcytosine-specific restriction endonuclease McrA